MPPQGKFRVQDERLKRRPPKEEGTTDGREPTERRRVQQRAAARLLCRRMSRVRDVSTATLREAAANGSDDVRYRRGVVMSRGRRVVRHGGCYRVWLAA